MKISSKISKIIKDQKKKIHKKLDTWLTKRSRWKLYIWLFVGVSLSILPLFYQLTYSWLIASPLEITQIISDYVFVAFAITGNLLGMILDSENFKIKKWTSPVK